MSKADGKFYSDKADVYCEEHGIIEYKVIAGKLIFYANYPEYLSEKRRTYRVEINLDTMKEERKLVRYNKLGQHNMYK